MKNKKKIVYIVGTRPEIIRSAGVISRLKKDPEVNFRLIHTGQHYDYEMSESFFKELKLPMPDKNLKAGKNSKRRLMPVMTAGLEEFFEKFNPDIIAVLGDTYSSLAALVAAMKYNIPIAHLEAGPREWDMSLPEEKNRRLIDHASNVLFAVSDTSAKNLRDEKVLGKIFNTGDPLYEVFQKNFRESKSLDLREKLGLKEEKYIFLTMHRAGNVDDPKKMKNVLDALRSLQKYKVVWPIHPRTKARLEKLKYAKKGLANFVIIEPLENREVLHLIAGASIVVTDSGGLQKEVFWSKVPCITLRDITAWSETVDLGVNFLAGTDKKRIIDAVRQIDSEHDKIQEIFNKIKDPYYKSDTVERTVSLIKKFAGKKW
ncbi:UDP-N-acetylglucosamine 2-epimerase (non-hydrolyzing) [Candidatus Giovannonibacteria bacterium]|nr:UDP-N-acetylglucosamine 2-epimerase (non-hydrolyzing) [Candidatus Giovannonibacteria bacterium]